MARVFSEAYLHLIVHYLTTPNFGPVKPNISDATRRLREWREKKGKITSWSGAKYGMYRTYGTALTATGELSDYFLSQAMNQTFILNQTPTGYSSVVGILPDFPAYNDSGKMAGLERIHDGGFIGSKGIASFRGKWVPPRPFILWPANYRKPELITTLINSFISKIEGLNLKQQV